MANDDEHDHTHRVVGKTHLRTNEGDGPFVRYEPGDPITPTEGELESVGDRFRPIAKSGGSSTDENAESGGESGPGEDTTETPDDTDDGEDDAQGGESEAESVPGGTSFTVEQVEDADRDDLRSLAGDHDDVNGNWGTDRLRAELRQIAESED